MEMKMPIFNLFSKRQKRLRGEVPDVYQYDDIPQELRAQIIHIWQDAFGNPNLSYSKTDEAYKALHDMLAREYGVFQLSQSARSDDYQGMLFDFLLTSRDVEKVLDAVEASLRFVSVLGNDSQYVALSHPSITPTDAIEEINQRFREHGIGYQFESGEIVRVDSQYIHAEAVKPALGLLRERYYRGANEEFLKAHDHYRHGSYKECLNECLKAFESTMKAICDKRGWTYNSNDTASRLIEVCFREGLIPNYLQSQFTSLRTSLESGVPTVRNRLGGHGQGSQQTVVPGYLAGYLLHLTATNILLLVEAEKELP
jgi:hypothetical protein